MVSSETVRRILASTLELKNIEDLVDPFQSSVTEAVSRFSQPTRKSDQCKKHPFDVPNRRERGVKTKSQNHSLALMRET